MLLKWDYWECQAMKHLTLQSFHGFSIFQNSFLTAWFPTTRGTPITNYTVSIPVTAGAVTIVERRPTPVIPNPIAVTPKQLSTTLIVLTPVL